MGKVAAVALGLQKVKLTGLVPNGQHFIANPKILWGVKESRATLTGEELSQPMSLPVQARLVDF